MLECINRYRNAKERSQLILGFKAYMRITNGKEGESCLKTALMDLKTAKKGSFLCEKEIRMLLCDLYAILTALGLGIFLIKWIKGCADSRE